jgi:hypothetical protein
LDCLREGILVWHDLDGLRASVLECFFGWGIV